MTRVLPLFFGFLLLCLAPRLHGQTVGSATRFATQHSGNFVLDKNFYFLSEVERDKGIMDALGKNAGLQSYLREKQELIRAHVNDTCQSSASLLNGFLLAGDTVTLYSALDEMYGKFRKEFDRLIDEELRPSGCYYRFNALTNREFLQSCWRETFKGINIVLLHYGFGTNLRYPNIDSASYDIRGNYYISSIKNYFAYLNEQAGDLKGFFQPALSVAIYLLQLNERHEPANYEPLESGDNKAAIAQVARTRFEQYAYSAILVPGQGPELEVTALDPGGLLRCVLAASRFKKGLAPFIIVSGGNVHPFHTPYTEALEMKKYLVRVDSIPESAVIIEPQARHTTTNFRNAARLMIRYGFPVEKPMLCVSTKDQEDYIMDDKFDRRNVKEMGYLPYREKKRVATHEISYFVTMDCLQNDPIDPLDP